MNVTDENRPLLPETAAATTEIALIEWMLAIFRSSLRHRLDFRALQTGFPSGYLER